MRLVSPDSELACVPLRIVDGVGTLGAWLGGRPPKGITPPVSAEALRYFATVPLVVEPALHVSIFVSDLERIMGFRGQVNEGGVLQAVTHPVMSRESATSKLDSPLSEHSLMLLERTDDWVEDDDGQRVVRPDHKIGGRPHLVRERTELLAALASIRGQGYVLIAQFDFPRGEDAVVTGDWPFADGMVALFGREPFGEQDWRWYWDF
jgi:hypothetical protein